MSYARFLNIRKSGHPDQSKAKWLIISFFSFVGGKKVGEKSARNSTVKSIGHFTQKFRNA